MMSNPTLDAAIEKLGKQFAGRNWKYLDVPAGSPMEKSYAWPGLPEENIMIGIKPLFNNWEKILTVNG